MWNYRRNAGVLPGVSMRQCWRGQPRIGIGNCPQLVVPDDIAMLTLPAYSRELNPIDNVRDDLRQNKPRFRVWDSYEDIVEAANRPGIPDR